MQAQLPAVVVSSVIDRLLRCRQKQDLREARLLYALLCEGGLDPHPILSNFLVPLLVECGSLPDAQHVFDTLTHRSEHSWTSLISGYTHHGDPHHAFLLFHQMQAGASSPQPNRYTYLALLHACARLKDTEKGHAVHDSILKLGMDTYVFSRSAVVGNTLVDMYVKCGSLAEASQIFDKLPIQNEVSWAALIAGYSEHGLAGELQHCLEDMQRGGISPDPVMFACSLKACSTIGALQAGHSIHADTIKRGFEAELYVFSALVDMYSKFGLLAEADQVFDRQPVRSSVAWNALIAGYAKKELDHKVLNSFNQMQLEGISPDAVTCFYSLKACAVLEAFETGLQIHSCIIKKGLEKELYLGSTLVDMYGQCGFVVEAREIFDQLPTRDVVLWSAIIKSYGENHEGHNAVKCFEEMQKQGVKPDAITFTCLLAACSHASLVLEGQMYFDVMVKEYQIRPALDHYVCMVDLFARTGSFHEAARFLAATHDSPSADIFKAFFSSCKIYGEVDLGHRCFQKLVEMDEEDAASYLLMADLYISAGRQVDAERIEETRKDASFKKQPGNTTLEVNKMLYEFSVGCTPNKHVSRLVNTLSWHLKHQGYVPNLDFVLKSLRNEENELISHEVFNQPVVCFSGDKCKCVSSSTLSISF